jgi:hypothetical protein
MSRKASFRLLLGLAGIATMFMLVVGAGSAKPPPSAAVAVVCDTGVGSATVTVTLYVSVFNQTVLGTGVYTCGPDSISGLTRVREKLVATGEPGFITAGVSMTTATGTGGCFLNSVPTLKDTCQIDGAGPAVSVTVR